MLEQLKTRYPGGIYEGVIEFTDEAERRYEVSFVYRKPTTADIEAHSKSTQRNPIIANLNLIQSLIVHPDSAPIIDRIREYPVSYGRFVEEALIPFFGGGVVVKSRKL